jgi:hypothetical protein
MNEIREFALVLVVGLAAMLAVLAIGIVRGAI